MQLGLALGFFLVPWAVTRVKGNGMVIDLGVRARWEDLWKGGLIGIVDAARAPLLYWPLLELLDKGADDLDGPAQALTDRANSPVDVVLLVLIVGVMAAVFEEIFFRGLVQRSFLKRGLHPVLAIGITSVFFGVTHFQLLQFPGLIVAGTVFGTLAYRADRLGPAMAAHLTFNMVTVIASCWPREASWAPSGATMAGAMTDRSHRRRPARRRPHRARGRRGRVDVGVARRAGRR